MKGDEIRAWREQRGLSRDELAKICHTTYASVANWELDRAQPNKAAGQKLKDLMAGRIALMPLTPQEERLLDAAVKRGNFSSREEFLAFALIELVKEDRRRQKFKVTKFIETEGDLPKVAEDSPAPALQKKRPAV